MNRWLSQGIVASVLIHGLVVLILFLQSPTSLRRQAVPSRPIEFVDIEVPVAPQRTTPAPQKSSPQASPREYDFSLGSSRQLFNNWNSRLESYATEQTASAPLIPDPGTNSLEIHGSGSDPSAALEPGGPGWSAAAQFANGMDLQFTNETLPFFEALFRKVDGRLVYPDDFARQRLTGTIRIEAELGRDGRIRSLNLSHVEGNVLQAYLIVYLIHVLRDPLPERNWLSTENAIVAFDFDLRTRIVGQPPSTRVSGPQKNRLLFSREAVVDSKVNEKINELFTHYVPPILPLPGGFYVDLAMAYQFVRNFRDGAPTESEARRRRVQSLHRELLQTIHRQSPSQERPPDSASSSFNRSVFSTRGFHQRVSGLRVGQNGATK